MRVVVVGAGLAGVRTVERLRRSGFSGPVLLCGDEVHAPYDRPPLSKSALVQDADPEQSWLRRGALSEIDVGVRFGRAATGLDLAGRTVLFGDDAEPYDRLVVATGARSAQLPGVSPSGRVRHLRSYDDAVALRRALRTSRSVVVVGAGVLGCEIAASARQLGCEVELVDRLPQPMLRVLGAELGATVARLHAEQGVRVRTAADIDEVVDDPTGGRVTVRLADGTRLEPQLVIVAVGSRPNVEWLKESGLELDDGVVCDETGATSAEDVFAVGDVAAVRGDLPHGRVEHWTHAAGMAAVVAGNLFLPSGQRRRMEEPAYVWSDQYGLKFQVFGRPGDADVLTVVRGRLDASGFVALHSRGGVVTAVSGVGHPREVAALRKAGLGRSVAETEGGLASQP